MNNEKHLSEILESFSVVGEYEISFETREYEYEYKLDAKTGKILEKDIDKND